MSLRRRTATALVLIALLVLVVQYAPAGVFFAFVQAFALAALFELYGLARRRGIEPSLPAGTAVSLLAALPFAVRSVGFGPALSGAFILAGLAFLFTARSVERIAVTTVSLAVTVFGALFLSLSLNHLYLVRQAYGPQYLYFLFAVIFVGDTAAYGVGTQLGRRKMAPLASPRKTWEGAIGGLAGAALAAIGARAALAALDLPLAPDLGPAAVAAGGLVVHAFAQSADLVESLFKRAAGVKDSSNLLPGHGGFLDRVDSFLFAAPVFYYLLSLVARLPGNPGW